MARVSLAAEPDGVLRGGPSGWRCFNHHDYPTSYCLRGSREVWWVDAPTGSAGTKRSCPDPGGGYAQTGSGTLHTRGVPCDVAWESLIVWNRVFRGGRAGTLRFGPIGYSCRVRINRGEGGGGRYTCRRGSRRLSFAIGA